VDDAMNLVERDARVCWHPYTQHGLEPDPLPVARARGAWLELEDGRRVLDAISSWWACLHGHAHPAIVAAIARQAGELDHVLFAGATHEPAVRPLPFTLFASIPNVSERMLSLLISVPSAKLSITLNTNPALTFTARRNVRTIGRVHWRPWISASPVRPSGASSPPTTVPAFENE